MTPGGMLITDLASLGRALGGPCHNETVTTMRARMRALEGEAVRWDGTNADDLQTLAGEWYEGTYASSALIRNRDGELVHVRPGWVISRWDGTEGVSVSSGGAWKTWAEELQ